MSIWASVSKMLALLLVCGSQCIWGSEEDSGCDWEVSSLSQDVHMNLKLPKSMFQSCLPKSGVF